MSKLEIKEGGHLLLTGGASITINGVELKPDANGSFVVSVERPKAEPEAEKRMYERVYYQALKKEQMLDAFKDAGMVKKRVEFRRNLNFFVGDVRDVAEMIRTASHALFYVLKETTDDGSIEYEIGCRFCRFGDDDCVCNIRMNEAIGKALFEKYGFKEHQQ